MSKLPAANAVVLLATESEYHAPVVATLFTTTTWFPVAVPGAAVAVTIAVLDDVADMEEAVPPGSPNPCKEVCSVETRLSSELMALVCP
ncbi:MAG TPA: hypothetical protein VN658_00450 [Candidatus Acidoferrales bacterium]|nr:hypothetical protein [Candidatus Acidoferrales bacterium]